MTADGFPSRMPDQPPAQADEVRAVDRALARAEELLDDVRHAETVEEVVGSAP